MLDNSSYKGYRGEALSALKKFKALVWSDVVLKTAEGSYKGIILPRSETADDKHIVLKMPIGYNIGIAAPLPRMIKANPTAAPTRYLTPQSDRSAKYAIQGRKQKCVKGICPSAKCRAK